MLFVGVIYTDIILKCVFKQLHTIFKMLWYYYYYTTLIILIAI